VSRVDIDRPGLTYTIHTLRDLRAQRGADAELFFITGADALAQILSWKDAGELFDLAHFVGVTRPGHLLSNDGLPREHVSLLEVPALAISSTDCRDRVEAGLPVWYLVPDGVVQYIAKHRLYAGAPQRAHAMLEEARDAAPSSGSAVDPSVPIR
jgi:nicotinate-nucleotide adenylyltransferase